MRPPREIQLEGVPLRNPGALSWFPVISPKVNPGFMAYGLLDPRTGQLRYIGATSMTPLSRYQAHIHDRQALDTPKNLWVRELRDLGLFPIMLGISHWPTADKGYDAEVRLIAACRAAQMPLLNVCDGGLGVTGYKWSEEERRLHSRIAAQGSRVDAVDRDEHTKREEVRRLHYRRNIHTRASRGAISEANSGDNNHQAKLTAEKVAEIRRRLADGEIGVDLANEFGIGTTQMSRIRRGFSWKT